MSKVILRLSDLRKTWIFDFDGTLVEHNGYKTGNDVFLPGAKEFLSSIPEDDFVLVLTAREKGEREATENFLRENSVRFNEIIFEMPMGERILFNDSKPSGLQMAYAVECARNQGLKDIEIIIDKKL
jgi:hypothetical protein